MCIELENKTNFNNFLKQTNNSSVMTRPVWELMSNLPMYINCQEIARRML